MHIEGNGYHLILYQSNTSYLAKIAVIANSKVELES